MEPWNFGFTLGFHGFVAVDRDTISAGYIYLSMYAVLCEHVCIFARMYVYGCE